MTPSSAHARLVSIRLMSAWGYGECKILPTSIPGRLRSSVYLPDPVVLPAESTMAIDLPITESSLMTDSLLPTPASCLSARLLSPRGLPGTSASTPCNGINCYSKHRESPLHWDQGYSPAASARSS